jgi:type IX secretion system PorP/SprF family membrane protein
MFRVFFYKFFIKNLICITIKCLSLRFIGFGLQPFFNKIFKIRLIIMKLGKFILSITALLGFTFQTSAQDIHFSQFYASPLNLNPAATGIMPCDLRVSTIYRNQFASAAGSKAYNTFSAGVEGKYNAGTNDYYALGFNLWADKAGASAFSNVQASISASYHKRIGGKRSPTQFLTAGGQIGISQRSINTDFLQFGTQFNGDQFDGSLSSQENFGRTRATYGDLNAGVLWFAALDAKGKSNVYAGLSFSHLNRPDQSNILSSVGFEPLFMKYTIHGGGDFRVARRFAVVPNFAVYIQGPSIQSNFGSAIKFDLSKRSSSDQAFHIGAYTRLTTTDSTATTSKNGVNFESLILVTRVRFGSNNIGLSYDVNFGAKVATGGNGAFELSYIYTLCGGRGRPMTCPTFQ